MSPFLTNIFFFQEKHHLKSQLQATHVLQHGCGAQCWFKPKANNPEVWTPTTTSVCLNNCDHFLHNSPSWTLPPPAWWKKEIFLICRMFPSWKKERETLKKDQSTYIFVVVVVTAHLNMDKWKSYWNQIWVSLDCLSKQRVSMLWQEALQQAVLKKATEVTIPLPMQTATPARTHNWHVYVQFYYTWTQLRPASDARHQHTEPQILKLRELVRVMTANCDGRCRVAAVNRQQHWLTQWWLRSVTPRHFYKRKPRDPREL